MAQAKQEGRPQGTATYRMMGCACNTARAGQGKGPQIWKTFLQRSDHLSLLFSPTVGRRRTVKRYRTGPTQLAPTNNATSRTPARNESDCASARCNDRTHAGQHQTGQTCMGWYENGAQRAGDTVVSHACRPPCPRTQQNTVTLPLRTRPTNVNKPHYTTPGQTKTQLTSTDTDVPATQAGFEDKTTSSSATEPT